MANDPIVEANIAAHLEANDLSAATVTALDGYGSGVLRFLYALTRDPALADEAYSVFCENLWRGLPTFRGEGTFHSWAFRLARNAGLRVLQSPARRGKRNIPLSQAPAAAVAAERVRTATQQHLKTEVKDEVRRLREQLSVDEQTLLSLRIDRNMSWAEVAEVMSEDGASAEQRARLSANLRKRYERVKDRLRELVQAAKRDS